MERASLVSRASQMQKPRDENSSLLVGKPPVGTKTASQAPTKPFNQSQPQQNASSRAALQDITNKTAQLKLNESEKIALESNCIVEEAMKNAKKNVNQMLSQKSGVSSDVSKKACSGLSEGSGSREESGETDEMAEELLMEEDTESDAVIVTRAMEKFLLAEKEHEEDKKQHLRTIVSNLFSSEAKYRVAANYLEKRYELTNHEIVTHREIIIDWLVSVHENRKVTAQILYTCVNLFDRFLEKKLVSREHMQLVAATALLIACKQEDFHSTPSLSRLVSICADSFTKKHLKQMEKLMLNTLNFEINPVTTLHFGEWMCKIAEMPPKTEQCARYLMELTLQDATFLKYLPSSIAAAACYLAMKTTGHQWSANFESGCRYSFGKLKVVLLALKQLAAQDSARVLCAVRKKYASETCYQVSTLHFGEL